jgi:hypothetical protein
MLLPQELLDCVVFLGEKTTGDNRLAGTGFFVSVPSQIAPSTQHVYLVTAAHCVENPSALVVRFNNPSKGEGLLTWSPPTEKKWLRIPQPANGEGHVDMAALPVPDSLRQVFYEAGYRWVPQSMFFDEALLGDDPSQGVGVGDDVVALGLLTVHSGSSRNAPVVRTGNLSLVPEEPIMVNSRNGPRRMRLYLTELRSIGGLSGSPVFVRHRSQIGAPATPVSLLGIMIGHWDDSDRNHMGFGMVVPAPLLGELLGQERAVKQREKVEKERLATEPVAVEDSAPSEFERFEDLTRKLVKVPKSEVDEKRKPT